MSQEVIEINKPVTKQVNRVNKGEALELYFVKGLTMQQIADHFGVDKSAVSRAIHGFLAILEKPESIQSYKKSKPNVLTAVEMRLVEELINPDKLKEASLNNVAYAMQQIHNILSQETKSGSIEGKASAVSAIFRKIFDKQGNVKAIEKEVKVSDVSENINKSDTLQKILNVDNSLSDR
jgi:predicted DNA-binding protein YlxM (UPF0122 family)